MEIGLKNQLRHAGLGQPLCYQAPVSMPHHLTMSPRTLTARVIPNLLGQQAAMLSVRCGVHFLSSMDAGSDRWGLVRNTCSLKRVVLRQGSGMTRYELQLEAGVTGDGC